MWSHDARLLEGRDERCDASGQLAGEFARIGRSAGHVMWKGQGTGVGSDAAGFLGTEFDCLYARFSLLTSIVLERGIMLPFLSLFNLAIAAAKICIVSGL